MADPAIKTIGDIVVAVWPPQKIVCEFAKISDRKDGCWAEVTVLSEVGAVYWSGLNLASTTGRRDFARELDARHPMEDWRGMLDTACRGVVQHRRKGTPAVYLEPHPPTEARWLITDWMRRDMVTILYGMAGSAKSYLALATGLSGVLQHTLGLPWAVGPIRKILYLDWEATRDDHEGRVWSLCSRIEMPPKDCILYREEQRPLSDIIDEVRNEALVHQVDFIILDSLIPASGYEPESADAASRTLRALKTLPGTKLVIGHPPKGDDEKAERSVFGSVVNKNLARSNIEVRRQPSDDAGTAHLTLYQRKTNDRGARPLGCQLTWEEDDTVTIGRSAPDPAGQSAGARILAALAMGRSTSKAISDETGIAHDLVRSTLARLEGRSRVLRLATAPGKQTQWGPIDTRRSTES